MAVRKLSHLIIALGMSALFSGNLQAEPSLLGARVGAMNPPALAEFYKEVFGVIEVNRFTFPDGGIEVMLGFAKTVAEFQASRQPEIVLFPRPSDEVKDEIPHLIFHVDDVMQAMSDIQATGGRMQTAEPITIPAGNGFLKIAIAVDPAGNLLEMIQQP